ncbi:hypothetical protein [Microbacterium aurantiacum]|uniref:hypothetical protein n=1 Tax=Microbacterium aurantiacum TaxID=162393 RepID=UPI000C80A389|nr:hypothetical protein [Microbacterium aurantiacum]
MVPMRALLFEPPSGVIIVPRADAAGDAAKHLPEDVPEAERTRVLTSMARRAADTDATVVLVWPEGVEPFGLWIQLTPISNIRLAREFVRGGADGWIGPLHAELVGEGLEWFSLAPDEDSTSRWSAVFADDDLFVNLTLSAPSFSDLAMRRAFIESMVLPSLVIAEDADPWRSDHALTSGVIVAKENWPQLAGSEVSA